MHVTIKGKQHKVLNKVPSYLSNHENFFSSLRWYLNLDGLGIKSIDEIKGLQEMGCLEYLSLNDNEISTIKGLETLEKLRFLSLGGNAHISKIENLDSLKNLERLLIWGTKIQRIEGVKNLEKLEWLSLNRNQIERIEGLENLKSLQYLQLNGNKISKIENWEKLPNLESISLDNNKIKQVQSLESLPNLRWLSIENNLIQSIAPFLKASGLEEVRLTGNPLPDDLLRNIDLTTCAQWHNGRMEYPPPPRPRMGFRHSMTSFYSFLPVLGGLCIEI